jgi:hypothetical protein
MNIDARGIIFDADQAPADCRSCAFTSVTRLTNGDLLVAFRIGTGRDTPDGRLRIMRSRDEGDHWETLHPGMSAHVDGVEGNLYSGYFTELASDCLIGAFVWVDRSNPALSFVNPQTAGVLPMRALFAHSVDGGDSWGPFREVDLGPENGCSCTGSIFTLAGGDLALPYESWKNYDDPSPGHHVAWLRVSSDGGQTWPEQVSVAADSAGRRFYWDQRSAAHPETGDLVAMFWTHDREREQDIDNHIAWGSPDGRRWSEPISAGWRGQHCQPLALGGDDLMALYVHRHDPPSLRAVVSHDFGTSWQSDEELVFYESEAGTEPGSAGEQAFEAFWQDMMAWRFGHPRGVLLPSGQVFVAFYAGNDAATSMHWVRITP